MGDFSCRQFKFQEYTSLFEFSLGVFSLGRSESVHSVFFFDFRSFVDLESTSLCIFAWQASFLERLVFLSHFSQIVIRLLSSSFLLAPCVASSSWDGFCDQQFRGGLALRGSSGRREGEGDLRIRLARGRRGASERAVELLPNDLLQPLRGIRPSRRARLQNRPSPIRRLVFSGSHVGKMRLQPPASCPVPSLPDFAGGGGVRLLQGGDFLPFYPHCG